MQAAKRKLTTAAHLLRHDAQGLRRIVTGTINYWCVFSTTTSDISPVEIPEGTSFRKLADEELSTLGLATELREEQLQRMKTFGANTAYAVFVAGRIGHISWLVTDELERRQPPRFVGLETDEAEITGCVTLPDFRGQGLYPIAIRSLCQIARERGIQTVFMKTLPTNVASQRGIEKAGLRRHARIVQWVLPFQPHRQGLIIRGHRWLRRT